MDVYLVTKMAFGESCVFENAFNEYIEFIKQEFEISDLVTPENINIFLSSEHAEGAALAFHDEYGVPKITFWKNFTFESNLRKSLFYHELTHVLFSDLNNNKNYKKIDEFAAILVQNLLMNDTLQFNNNFLYGRILAMVRKYNKIVMKNVLLLSLKESLKLGEFSKNQLISCGFNENDASWLLTHITEEN